MTNVNFKQFEDQFGNVIQEFEVIKYEKYANGEWIEVERRESGRTYYNLDGKLFHRLGRTSFELNMDFDSTNCGACYQVGREIENNTKITGNYDLITVSYPKGNMTLKKQTYSNDTCFYSFQDERGNSKVNHGSKDINEILNQLLHENNTYSKSVASYNSDTIKQIIDANNDIISFIEVNVLKVA